MYNCTNCGAWIEDVAYVNGWIECYDCASGHNEQPAYIVYPMGSDGDEEDQDITEDNHDLGEAPQNDPEPDEWDSPQYWLLTEEDRDFNRNN